MKNVEIAEGNVGRRLNGVSEILTDVQESEDLEAWVNEEDYPRKPRYASKTGWYHAKLDVVNGTSYAYSTFTVSRIGEYIPPEFTDPDGNPIDPALFPEMPTIDIDGITFPAIDPLVENELGELEPVSSLFPDEEIEPVAVPDIVGTEGSAITGIDADGLTYMVGVDENGNIRKTEVPTGIKVLELPDNLEGTDGLKVAMVDKNGNIVKTKEYPTGIIDNASLENEVVDGIPNSRSYEGVTVPYHYGFDIHCQGIHQSLDYDSPTQVIFKETITASGDAVIILPYNYIHLDDFSDADISNYQAGNITGGWHAVPQVVGIFASPNNDYNELRYDVWSKRAPLEYWDRVSPYIDGFSGPGVFRFSSGYKDLFQKEIDGKTVYWTYIVYRSFANRIEDDPLYNVSTSRYNRKTLLEFHDLSNPKVETPFLDTWTELKHDDIAKVAWTAIYGNPEGMSSSYKVSWSSPYTGETYEARKPIETEQ